MLFLSLSSSFCGVLLQSKGVGSTLLVDEMVVVWPRGMLLDVRHPRVALLVARGLEVIVHSPRRVDAEGVRPVMHPPPFVAHALDDGGGLGRCVLIDRGEVSRRQVRGCGNLVQADHAAARE